MFVVYRSEVANRVEDPLKALITRPKGKFMSAKAAQHEWDERFFPMRLKSLGPSLIPSEAIIPVASVAKVIAQAEKALPGINIEGSMVGTEVQLRVGGAKGGVHIPVIDFSSIVAEALGFESKDTTEYMFYMWGVFEKAIEIMNSEVITTMMSDMMPAMFPGMMPKLMPTVLKMMKQAIPNMPIQMEEKLPKMLPKVMAKIMPGLMAEVAPALAPKMTAYLAGR